MRIIVHTESLRDKFEFILEPNESVYNFWIKVEIADVICMFQSVCEASRSISGDEDNGLSIQINDDDIWVGSPPTIDDDPIPSIKPGPGDAAKLAEPRNINITGAVAGSAEFDGSEDITIQTSVNHNHDDNYAAKDHNHNYAGSESAGGAAVSAIKSINMIATNLGGFNNRTVASFKTALKNWWAESAEDLYPMASFLCDDSWITNFANDTATLTGASLWQVTPIGGSAQNGTYGGFLISSYGSAIYLLPYNNGTFSTPVKLITSNDVSSLAVSSATYAKFFTQNYIEANTDLNTIKTQGFYNCSSNSTAVTLSNCPTERAFGLIVGRSAGVFQILIEFMVSGQKIYTRNWYEYDNVWGDWIRVYTTTDKPSASDIGAATADHTHNYTATKVKGDAETTYRSGDVNLTPANLGAVALAGGTMTGQLVAQANTAYTTAQVRNITMSTADPSGGTNGQIHFKYT